MIENKFCVGQRVYLFNSVSMEIESDEVYAILFVPIAVDGVEQKNDQTLEQRIKGGQMKVQEQYQLAQHQGVLDAECLFASEEECLAFFRAFFTK